MAFLRELSSESPVEFEIVKSLTTIGSDNNADIIIDKDKLIPKVAVHILRQGANCTLVASAEKYPIYVGVKPVSKHLLIDGDEITIGPSKWRFERLSQASTSLEPGKVHKSEMDALQKLLQFSRKLAHSEDLNYLMEVLIDEVISISGAERGFLVLLRENKPHVKIARHWHQKNNLAEETELSDSILQTALQNQSPILVSDAKHDSAFSASASVVNLRLTSVMCVPLIYRNITLGAIYLGNNSLKNAFDVPKLELVSVFSGQAALLVHQSIQIQNLAQEANELKQQIEIARYGDIIGSCKSMQAVFQKIDKIADSDVGILITGETGTGKELIARELHRKSGRAKQPFVTINCGAIPENLLESELFGHVRGAFTGAVSSRGGRFQAAHLGTIFLDEIAELPLHLQVKILRVLQDKQVCKVGENKAEILDTRIIAATHRDLFDMVKKGQFREDLFYRLNIVPIHVPPLRDRGNDVLVLANYFIHKFAASYNKRPLALDIGAQNALLNYAWPGNVRQLENHLRRALVMTENTNISAKDLDIDHSSTSAILPLGDAVERFKASYIQNALDRNAGNRTKAAKELGIDPRTIFRYLEEQKGLEDSHAL